MKLRELIIKKLYGHYNYNVVFNEDVTIIFGANGSGKTTVLNILECIISGRIYDLFKFDFEEVRLDYVDAGKNSYVSVGRKDNGFYFNFNERNSKINFIPENIKGKVSELYIEERFYERNSFLKALEDYFKRIYLTLDRVQKEECGENRRLIRELDNKSNIALFQPIKQVEEIIMKTYLNIESKVSKLDELFRHEILKAYLTKSFDENTDISKLFSKSVEDIEKLNDSRGNYLKLLKELNLVDDDGLKSYEIYFEKLIKFLKDFDVNVLSRDFNVFLRLVVALVEINKIESIKYVVNKFENEKSFVREPLTKFVDVVNEFLSKGANDCRHIVIDGSARPYLTNIYNEKITLCSMSSGEKQIVILFAYLIFKLGENKSAVFIIDEPELSLHLMWQRIYIDKIREVAPNVQIIFATHSPEIVANYRDKMYKLVRESSVE